MADELPEKVLHYISSHLCRTIVELETFARLAIEEATMELREKLENAEEGYARRHKDATDLWEKINFPGGLNAQILELRERLERQQEIRRFHWRQMLVDVDDVRADKCIAQEDKDYDAAIEKERSRG